MNAPALDLGELSRIALLVSQAGSHAGLAAITIDTEHSGEAGQQANTLARTIATEGEKDAKTALQMLLNMGIDLPRNRRQSPPLSSLARLDTPASRELIDALNAAATIAARVDRERGDLDEEGNPDNWARRIGLMADTLRLQVYGPDCGGRE